MDFKSLKIRSITSLFLMLIFAFIFLIYDIYLEFFIYLMYLIILFEILLFFRKNILIFLISCTYLFISFICLILYFKNFYLNDVFLYTVLLIIFFDISSYLFGSRFGKLKILPNISPNKTFFGLFSGFMSTYFIGLVLNYFFEIFNINILIFFIFFTLLFAFAGDLLESFFKRKLVIKDSSYFLPGHGGFFDRFDSFIMVIIWLFLFHLII